MGGIEPLGPAASGLIRLDAPAGAPAAAGEQSIFDGIDVTVAGLGDARRPARWSAPGGAHRHRQRRAAGADQRISRPSRPVSCPQLAAGLTATRAARQAVRGLTAPADARADADFLLAVKERDFTDALVRAAGVVVDPLADAETVVPGGTLNVSVRTFLADPRPGEDRQRIVAGTGGLDGGSAAATAAVIGPGCGTGRATAARDAERRNALRRDRARRRGAHAAVLPGAAARGRHVSVAGGRPRTLPFDQPLLMADVTLEIGGAAVSVSRPAQYRIGRSGPRRAAPRRQRRARGVGRPRLAAAHRADRQRRRITQRLVVRTTSYSATPMRGSVRLRLPAGWTAAPAEAPLTLASEGEPTRPRSS